MSEIAIAIVIHDQKVLLVKRKMKEDCLLWQFPGGGIETGESAIQACIREVKEETNVNCIPEKCLGNRTHPNTGKIIDYWACQYESGIAMQNLDDDLEEVRWVSYEELFFLITSDLYEPVAHYLKELLL